MVEAVLNIQQLCSGYGQATVIRDLNLAINRGEIVAVVGKNGMGKSTLLKSIMGYLPAFSGNIMLFGRTVANTAPHRIARLGVAYVPQEKAVFQDLSVEENIRLALRKPLTLGDAKAVIARCFPFLLDRMRQRAGTLSGGEQKMLLVARALAVGAEMLLVDEITEGLQPSVIESLVKVIRSEREQSGTAVLLVEQNIAFTCAVSDRYVLLDKGEIAGVGETSDPDTPMRVTAHLTL
jgi:branched-chain amino acid transport system ATP-binding protein